MCLKGLKKNILNGNSQLNWEFLKYEIQKFAINYSKNITKNTKNMTERLQGDSNSQPFSSQTSIHPSSKTGQMIKLCFELLDWFRKNLRLI